MGKTHLDTLATIMNMVGVYTEGLEDFAKAEEMTRLALDGFEKSLGKGHKDTKDCARILAILCCFYLKTRALIKEYPVLLKDGWGFEGEYQDALKELID